MTPKFPPYTARDLINTGWVTRTRGAILKDGYAIRVGSDQTIQAQVINQPDDWRPIMLPNGSYKLVDFRECVKVLDMLEGKTPIPPPTPKPA